MEIKSGKKVFIRTAGKDEYWLQDLIFANPSILGLGELVPVSKEKKQSKGGRLDILLEDPEDKSRYEVEVMLGETDPSHIIRAIEYWDLEKRKYPQRQHFPVLIAESFDRRYFNVIHILSLNVPMIAIQADLISFDGQQIINFTKILDIYEEIDETDSVTTNTASESYWAGNASWSLQTAKDLAELLNKGSQSFSLKFTQTYISLVKDGKNTYWLNKRATPKSSLGFDVKDPEKVEAIKNYLDNLAISYTYSNTYKSFSFTIDSEFLKKKHELILKVNEIRFPAKAEVTEE